MTASRRLLALLLLSALQVWLAAVSSSANAQTRAATSALVLPY